MGYMLQIVFPSYPDAESPGNSALLFMAVEVSDSLGIRQFPEKKTSVDIL